MCFKWSFADSPDIKTNSLYHSFRPDQQRIQTHVQQRPTPNSHPKPEVCRTSVRIRSSDVIVWTQSPTPQTRQSPIPTHPPKDTLIWVKDLGPQLWHRDHWLYRSFCWPYSLFCIHSITKSMIKMKTFWIIWFIYKWISKMTAILGLKTQTEN
jgi:hypothetical protein